jgi:hypothetical protein
MLCRMHQAGIPRISLRDLFRHEQELYMGGTFVAALHGRHQEEQLSTGDKIEGSAPRRAKLAGNRAEADVSDVQKRLSRLMPYEEWCTTLRPTDAGKELYLFVRERLEMRLADAVQRVRSATEQPRRRARRAKSSSQHPTTAPADEQQ